MGLGSLSLGQTGRLDPWRRTLILRKTPLLRALASPRSKEKVRRQGISYVRARHFADVSNIGTHSLRAGGATAAAKVSTQDRLFERYGRWVIENAKDDYVKDSIQSRLAVSRSLGI